jgi:hypothetical protein
MHALVADDEDVGAAVAREADEDVGGAARRTSSASNRRATSTAISTACAAVEDSSTPTAIVETMSGASIHGPLPDVHVPTVAAAPRQVRPGLRDLRSQAGARRSPARTGRRQSTYIRAPTGSGPRSTDSLAVTMCIGLTYNDCPPRSGSRASAPVPVRAAFKSSADISTLWDLPVVRVIVMLAIGATLASEARAQHVQ